MSTAPTVDVPQPGLEGLTPQELSMLMELKTLDASSLPGPCQAWPLGEWMFVEFLGLGRNPGVIENKNHVVLRVPFAHHHGLWWAARVSMDIPKEVENLSSDSEVDVHISEYLVKLLPFDGPSNRCRQHFKFRFKRPTTLGQLVGLGFEKGFAQDFLFIIKDEAWKGCRDFITQFYYWLVEEGFIDSLEVDRGVTLYSVIGFLYRFDGDATEMPVDKGDWKQGYTRVEKKGMGY
ncbi:hypothetical protein M407DRAFT_10735 [Tulasnella calospora MUT 4182]|uniref:Uncharacterized protein n=1 Tax=Tulasnella calospora MUT 4182 TaxID=1051891 RepID=A0A0C3Q8P9_9AGAM|nr:hypothetical protein M407DRAFT_10735 [Tulasnella calospora MUT 4182]